MIDTGTIAAIATPIGEGGIGVIRISGDDAVDIAQRIFRKPSGSSLNLSSTKSHTLHYGNIVEGDRIIDDVLLAWMKGPNTYTREDTVEISCHGGPLPMREVLRVALAAGARSAERGEFTLRAFLNGRLDLTQAEAVLNVIGAQTSESLRLAVNDLSGDLRDRLAPASTALVRLLAYLDASADFPDDEIETSDIPDGLTTAEAALADVIAGSEAGMLYRDGATIALVGRPNVGKSSLLNALLRSDRSIVTPIAGTTRDVIRESINLGGIAATLLDTAGIVETDDVVERIGVERSRQALATAALVALVVDGSESPTSDDLEIAQVLANRPADQQTPVIIVINKQDLQQQSQQSLLDLLPDAQVVHVSAKANDGISGIETAFHSTLASDSGVQPSLVNDRQRSALDRAYTHVTDAIAAHEGGIPQDLLATSVRAALHAVGEVTGENVDEAVLTEIFSTFCIGK